METTQGKAVLAYTTLAQMSRKPMPSLAAFKLFRLKKALSPIIEFQSEQEMKIVEELGGKVTDTGVIQFDSKEKRMEFTERHKELESMTCEVSIEKVELTTHDLPELSVTDMETLDDFIEWKE